MLPEISARRSLWEPRFRYLSPGSEGKKCRPLDHMWQIPFIHSVQFFTLSNLHIYIKVCRFFLPSGTDTYVLVWLVINNCTWLCFSKTLSPRLRTNIQLNCTCWHARSFSKRTYWRKKKKEKISHNLVPTNKIFVAFSLCSSQNKLKTKGYEGQRQKARTTLESHYARKRPGKNTSHSKNGMILKRWQKWPFCKGYSKANGRKWSQMVYTGAEPKNTKTNRNYPLKPLELFYAETKQKTT